MKLKLPFSELHIDHPCHEDWNKMLPDEKGRFCLSCKKTVLDFTQKTKEEILRFFRERKFAEACVRVNPNVLNKPTLTKAEVLRRRRLEKLAWFVYTLYIIFGATLFSCNNNNRDKHHSILATETISHVSSPLNIETPSQPEMKQGKKTHSAVKLDSIAIDNPEIINSSVPDTIQLPEVLVDDNSLTLGQGIVVGGLVVRKYYREFVVDDSLQLEKQSSPLISDETKEELSLFPNPSNGNFALRYRTPAQTEFQITAFDQSGALIKEILNEKNATESYNTINVDLRDQPAGIYFVRLQSGDTSITKRALVVH